MSTNEESTNEESTKKDFDDRDDNSNEKLPFDCFELNALPDNAKPSGQDPHSEFYLDGELEDVSCVSEEFSEIQTQLLADSRHLAATYPPTTNGRLEQLIRQCQTEVAQQTAAVTSVSPTSATTGIARRWYSMALAFSFGFLLVGAFAINGARQTNPLNEQPVVSNRVQSDVSDSAPVTVSSMPTELLNASQPELEAIYDQMGLVSISAEF